KKATVCVAFKYCWPKILLAVPQLLIAKSSPKGTAPQEKVMQKIIEIINLIIDVIDKSLRAIDIVKQKRIIVVL
ncbi:hypothetical protein, partial [Staphylococcus pseudintermedius]|uniref:hypothetical protein n=1 Tax=Staphylococcus pseudintermedius TaxID=283734 RepID=UPI000D8EFB50